jgi:hypothetical protein
MKEGKRLHKKRQREEGKWKEELGVRKKEKDGVKIERRKRVEGNRKEELGG